MINSETDEPDDALEQTHINELNQRAWNLRVIDSNQAFMLSREAVTLARQEHYQQGLAEGLRTLGFCHIRLSRYAEAQKMLEEAFSIFQALKNEWGQSDIYEYRGIIHRSQGDYAASLDMLFKSEQLRRQLQYQEGLALSCYHIGMTYKYLGDFDNALAYSLQGLSIARQIEAIMPESYLLNSLGGIYFETHDHKAALDYYNQSLTLRQRIGDQWGEAGCLDNIGTILLHQRQFDEALYFFERGLAICKEIGDRKGEGNTLFSIGKIYQQLNQPDDVLSYINQSLAIRKSIGDRKGQAELELFLGDMYRDAMPDYALSLLKQSLELAETVKAKDLIYKIHQKLAETLKQTGDFQAALTHFECARDGEKEVNSESVNQKLLNVQIIHRVEQTRKEAELYQLRSQELATLVDEIQHQKNEIEQQKNTLNEALQTLKFTQTQLIHKEKMASLGELTAGIAHEIQNPLNFVNNFSLLSARQLNELQQELQNSIRDIEMEVELIYDLKENLQKILQHGQRASSIIKGMLGHSRSATGELQSTDLNALTEEYLRLAYFGMRAKQQEFNCELVTAFDPSVGEVKLIPQEIGRVLLNLLSNAFYAVNEQEARSRKQGVDYQPTVQITTQRQAGQVLIQVKDNGIGMSVGVQEKIFQPFFTTKPTGQGTGLGLSLSFDIVTKGHGGTFAVESREGQGAAFNIILPIKPA